jgi:hypothetical protein
MSNQVAYTIGDSAITVTLITQGKTCTLPRSAPNASALIDALTRDADASEIERLLSVNNVLLDYSDGKAEIVGGCKVLFDGKRLPEVLEQRILACYRDGVPFDNLLAFFRRLAHNPSNRAVEGLYRFMETCKMPITPEGHLLGYKGVREDYYSATGNMNVTLETGVVDDTGRVRNAIGDVIAIPRSSVCDNPNNGCAAGLHVGSMDYATGWSDRTIIVSVDPADVVCIPVDSSFQKLRCCRYTVVTDFRGEMGDSGVRAGNSAYDAYDQAQGSESDIDVINVGCSTDNINTIPQAAAIEKARLEGEHAGSCDAREDEGDEYDPDSWDKRWNTPREDFAFRDAYHIAYHLASDVTVQQRQVKTARDAGALHGTQDGGAELEYHINRRRPEYNSLREEDAYADGYRSGWYDSYDTGS